MQNYTYDEDIDEDVDEGITINKDGVSINGTGYTIDGSNKVRIFNIIGKSFK